MKVTCPNCSFAGNISDKLIPDAGRNVSCPKCGTKFVVRKTYASTLNIERDQSELKTSDETLNYDNTASGEKSASPVDVKNENQKGIVTPKKNTGMKKSLKYTLIGISCVLFVSLVLYLSFLPSVFMSNYEKSLKIREKIVKDAMDSGYIKEGDFYYRT